MCLNYSIKAMRQTAIDMNVNNSRLQPRAPPIICQSVDLTRSNPTQAFAAAAE